MKRNLEMVRDILLIIEEQENNCTIHTIYSGLRDRSYNTEDYDVTHHLEIMTEHDLIDCDFVEYLGFGRQVSGDIRIKWNGHEYLDVVRDTGVWHKVQEAIGDRLDSVGLDVIKKIASEIIKNSIGM